MGVGPGEDVEDLSTSLAGQRIRVPVGLAAGFDKDGDLMPSMTSLGFGFLTVGSVTERGDGNPRPWFRRLTSQESMVNSMGLPSKGPDYVERNLMRSDKLVPIIISVAAKSLRGFIEISKRLSRYADAIELNISCPNLPKGNYFDEDIPAVEALLRDVGKISRPLFLKLPPYEEQRTLLDVLEIAHKRRVKGVTIANTKRVSEPTLPLGFGGLSGRPLLKDVKEMVKTVYDQYDDEFEIVATGGVFTGTDAYELLGLGANALGLLTALIYRGPGVVKRICTELSAVLSSNGLTSVDELRGRLAPR